MMSSVKRTYLALTWQIIRLLWQEKKGCFVASRPLELEIQYTFCQFSSANEHKHMPYWLMLVFYPTSAIVDSIVNLCSFGEPIINNWGHNITIFEEYKRLFPVEIPACPPNCSNTRIHPCLHISSSKTPHPHPPNFCPRNSKKSRPWYGMDIFQNHPFSTKANSKNTGYVCSLWVK